MRNWNTLFVLIFILVAHCSFAQKGLLKQADKYFEADKFQEALDIYERIEKLSENENALFRRGVSYFQTKNIDAALQDFTLAKRLGFDDNEIYLYTAKALHTRGSYSDASQFYKNYLRYVDDKKEEYRIIELIKQCKYGYNNQYNDQLAFVENLGASVNTEYNESNPVQSPSAQNKYYFSSNRSGSNGGLRNKKGYKDEIYGHYSADMYAIELTNGNWTSVSAFHPILNGPKQDLIQGFNPDGSVLFFLKTQNGEAGQMYADTFSVDKDPEAFPKLLRSPVISELGDKDLQVFNNQTILFSSKRAGGFGGYDLYVSYKNGDEWVEPINLGPEVNTKYNEVTPFLAKSGTRLYFSSDNVNGFGGYDIFEAIYDISADNWGSTQNVGIPVNSPSDEMDFSLSGDGMTAIFASDRIGTMGGSDLFLAYYKELVTDQLMYTETLPFVKMEADTLVLDFVKEESDVITANTEPENITKKEFYNEPLYYGADEMIITPANRSKLNQIKDILLVYPEVSIVLNGHSVKEGMREFDLYFSIKRAEKAASYLVENGVDPSKIKVRGLGSNYPNTKHSTTTISRLAEKNNRRIDISFVKVPTNRLKVVNELPTVSEALKAGKSEEYYNKLKGLSYKIEVAKTVQMFKGDVIRQYESGAIEKMYSDAEYTYTVGTFDNYNETKRLKSKLLREGIMNARIIPYMNDQELNMVQVEVLKDVYPDLGEYLTFEK